jgi:uncharacterized membrane protein
MSELPVPGIEVLATTISQDGNVIGGNNKDTNEYFRLENAQITTLPGAHGGLRYGLELSADGSVAAAGIHGPEMEHLNVYAYPMRWEGGVVTTFTDFLYGPYSPSDLYFSDVAAISSDGETLVINETRWLWEYDDVFIRCRGGCSASVPGEQEYVTHPLGHTVDAFDASADTSVVVGYAADVVDFRIEGAFVYEPVNGYRYLAPMIQFVYGINIGGWTLDEAVSVSSDGLVIVGTGTNPSGYSEAWLFSFGDSLPGPVMVPTLGGAAWGVLVGMLALAGALASTSEA